MKDEQMKHQGIRPSTRKIMRTLLICSSFIFSSFISLPAHAANVYMEEMTWVEINDRLKDGATTAIIPTGGTEQNGPHMITGKHNVIVRYTAGEIAKRLGNTMVAPVMVYVPEGRIEPPEGHMNFPGTFSVTEETFALLLQDTATSLKHHGFRVICFVGDNGGNQAVQKRVAQRLNEMWQSTGVRVVHVSDYYSNNGQDKWVQSIGLKVPNPSAHAGLEDTSELMAIYSSGVRDHLRKSYIERDYKTTGASGDSTQASPNYGRQFLELKIQAAVNQIARAAPNSK